MRGFVFIVLNVTVVVPIGEYTNRGVTVTFYVNPVYNIFYYTRAFVENCNETPELRDPEYVAYKNCGTYEIICMFCVTRPHFTVAFPTAAVSKNEVWPEPLIVPIV
jgi:hypothetical protein